MATQSHRSNGPQGLMTAGPPESSPHCGLPRSLSGDELPGNGNEGPMTSGGKINKQNPAGQTTATIGVPFTYKLTIPALFDPATGTVINASGSPNDLHGITVWDDLNATGADLSFVSERAYWLSNGTPIPHTFSNVGGFLTFDNFPTVLAGQQFVIEVTVVLRNTPANVPGKQFVNTAKWDF